MKQYDILVREIPDDPRLDKVIPMYCEGVSRSQARKLIETGAVYLNRKRCLQNAKAIRTGDKIRFFIGEQKEEETDELTLPLSAILFEDEDLIVVNKPPLIPTHATIDTSRHHLVLATQAMIAKRDGKVAKDVYLGVHHRLDRDTSGVILFTKRKEANAAVAQAFQGRDVQKTYYAAVLGTPTKKSFEVKSYIGPHPRNKRRFASIERGGKYAETQVQLLSSTFSHNRKISLVEAKPLTGRTHQIRVHLSENKLPILGDATYGVEFPDVPRLLLHAYRLEILGKQFEAPLPEDFLRLAFPGFEA